MNNIVLRDTKTTKVFDNMYDLNTYVLPFQREIIESHVDGIEQFCMKYILDGREPPLPSVTLVSYNDVNNLNSIKSVYGILDGQHRISAYARLCNKGYIIKIHSTILFCDSENEARELYQLSINKQMKHTNAERCLKHFILHNEIKQYLSTQPMWTSTNHNKPEINTIYFLDKCSNINLFDRIKTLDEFIQFINRKNQSEYNKYFTIRCKLNHEHSTNDKKYVVDKITTHNKIVNNNFYLGINKDWDWLNEA